MSDYLKKKPAEARPKPTMRVVRAWLEGPGVFKYFIIYGSGEVKPTTRRGAEQWQRAFDATVETILGEPQ